MFPGSTARSGSIVLSGAPNFRDLGGYRTEDGRVVRRGRVFRSGHFAELTDPDVATLEDLGIRAVIDLRLEFEVGIFGRDRLPSGASYLSLPITAGEMDAAAHEALREGHLTALPDLVDANRSFIRENTHELGVLLGMLADPAMLPLVFHCIGGKDRSGIVAAVVLSVLGVPWETVREDYLLTNDRYRDRIEEQLAALARNARDTGGRRLDAGELAAARRFFLLHPNYIDAARDEMIAVSGSIGGYVRDALGIPNEITARLRDSLLEAP